MPPWWLFAFFDCGWMGHKKWLCVAFQSAIKKHSGRLSFVAEIISHVPEQIKENLIWTLRTLYPEVWGQSFYRQNPKKLEMDLISENCRFSKYKIISKKYIIQDLKWSQGFSQIFKWICEIILFRIVTQKQNKKQNREKQINLDLHYISIHHNKHLTSQILSTMQKV